MLLLRRLERNVESGNNNQLVALLSQPFNSDYIQGHRPVCHEAPSSHSMRINLVLEMFPERVVEDNNPAAPSPSTTHARVS